MERALLIRQTQESLSLAKLLRSHGIEPYIYPLFKPRFIPPPPLKNLQGLIITSKNAIRALEGREDLKDVPLYAVGDQTATFAKKKGFSKVFSASGTSKELITLILKKASREKGILWHLSGDITKGNIIEALRQKGFQTERNVVYQIEERNDICSSLIFDLHNQRISYVLFFSSRAATIFVNLLKKNGLEKVTLHMTSLCLSQDVVDKVLILQWRKIWVSPNPTVNGMIGYFNEEKSKKSDILFQSNH